MSSALTDDQVILKAQQLYLINSHSNTLYDTIPHASRPSTTQPRPTPGLHVDVIVDVVINSAMNQMVDKMGLITINQPHLLINP